MMAPGVAVKVSNVSKVSKACAIYSRTSTLTNADSVRCSDINTSSVLATAKICRSCSTAAMNNRTVVLINRCVFCVC